MAAGDDEVAVVQRGRISFWTIAGDSMIPRAVRLPESFMPRSIEFGCNTGEVVLYGLELAAVQRQDSVIPYLYIARKPDGVRAEIEAVWRDSSGPATTVYYSRTGALIDRWADRIILLHAWKANAARRLIEFDCAIRPKSSYDEAQLIRGQMQRGIRIAAEGSAARQYFEQVLGEGGVAAVPDGFIVGVLRPAYREEPIRTELFTFIDGRPTTSILIRGSWRVMDYHASKGLLLATTRPVPHFIILPARAVALSR
jgi:hypothetical protein